VVSSAEVMPSRYRGGPLVTIGLPSSRRREIPTPGPAGRPTEGRLCALPTARTGAGTVDPMIEINAVTKRYGSTTAVSGLTFTVRPGVVTGFLGPNGAGKTTTMRMILGLDAPTSGAVTVNGRRPAGGFSLGMARRPRTPTPPRPRATRPPTPPASP